MFPLQRDLDIYFLHQSSQPLDFLLSRRKVKSLRSVVRVASRVKQRGLLMRVSNLTIKMKNWTG
jgi:hypothetical protein